MVALMLVVLGHLRLKGDAGTPDVTAAVAYQQKLRHQVILSGDISGADLIAGADTSSWANGLWGHWASSVAPPRATEEHSADDGASAEEFPADRGGSAVEHIHAAIVVWSLSQQKVVASAIASLPASFPYIQGLLAFREIPSLLEAWSKLTIKPDVIICDGHGVAHPRRCGIACHLGLELGVPSIGCGKTRLVGWHEEPGPEKGDWTDLLAHAPNNSKFQIPNSKLGRVVRTRSRVAPVFVSVGHLCDIEGATELILRTATRCRLPEPIRAAHLAAGKPSKILSTNFGLKLMSQSDTKYRILAAAPSLAQNGFLKALDDDPRYQIIRTDSAPETLKAAASESLDLILVDDDPGLISLPELVTKAKGANVDIPILVFRDGFKGMTDEKIWTLGIDDCIQRPVRASELLHHVTRALNSRQLGRHNEELRRENQELYQLAITDSLTRLINRRHFMERLGAEFSRAKRFSGRIGAVICDIDHFKKVNDTYGHGVGDRVLRQVSGILAATVRSIDTAGRYGGEEFVLLLPETAIEGVLFVAEKVRRAIDEFDFTPEDTSEPPGPAHITISLGAASYPESKVETPDELLQLSDQALYRAKEGGRNRVELA